MVVHQEDDKTRIEWVKPLIEVNSPEFHGKGNFHIAVAGDTWKQLIGICSVRNRGTSMAIAEMH